MKRLAFFAAAIILASPLAAATPPRPYHLELEANPAAPFPWLGKFGTVTLHVFPAGVRAETFWLNGWSRNGQSAVRVENPISRMYVDVPISHFESILQSLGGDAAKEMRGATPVAAPPLAGKVGGIDATRYRLAYGPQAWIDVWTTTAIPDNPQLHKIVDQLLGSIATETAKAARNIPGTPLYVELNFRRFHKVPLVKVKKLTFDDAGQDDALSTGMLYLRAPLPDSVWK